MITQRDLKYYSSLLIKKFRSDEEKFLVEGLKIVEEGLASDFSCEAIFATPAFIDSFPDLIDKIKNKTGLLITDYSSIFFDFLLHDRRKESLQCSINQCPRKK